MFRDETRVAKTATSETGYRLTFIAFNSIGSRHVPWSGQAALGSLGR